MERTAELFLAGSAEPEIIEEEPPADDAGAGAGAGPEWTAH